MHYAKYASFYGVPYWLFGLVWFPLVFLVGLWTTKIGRQSLRMELLIFLMIGNIFTGYLWYLDIIIVKSYTLTYVALYTTNYALTGLVVVDNWSNDVMHGYVYGTVTGAVVGLLFGPYGVAACGIAGGIFGAVRNYVIPKNVSAPPVGKTARDYLLDQKMDLEEKLKDIEAKLAKTSG